MFPIKHLRFDTPRLNGREVVRGSVNISATVDLNLAECHRLGRKFVIAQAQEKVEAALWLNVYGPLQKPLGELMILAMAHAPDADTKAKIEQLVAALQAKLTKPE